MLTIVMTVVGLVVGVMFADKLKALWTSVVGSK